MTNTTYTLLIHQHDQQSNTTTTRTMIHDADPRYLIDILQSEIERTLVSVNCQLQADEELNTRIDQVYTTMAQLHCTEDEAREHLGLPSFNE